MEESDSDDIEMPVVGMISVRFVESSADPPMEEWSSLEVLLEEENKKKVLHREGLYDPGDGELCAENISMSDSSVFSHPYYNYPAIIDPGIKDALLKPPDVIIYPNDGQALYLATCKEMNQVVVNKFHRELLESRIDLQYYCINPNGFRAMAKALRYNTTVQCLNLTDNFLNDDVCYHMGDMLFTNKTITEINLSGCRIGHQGAKILFSYLPKNKTLKALNLSHNKLGDEGMESLASAVLSGLNVKVLNLSYNEITGKGVAFLEVPFENFNKFTHLDLSWNKLFTLGSNVFFMKLAESECLEVLNLSWNALGGRNAKALRQIFFSPKLSEFNLSNNKLEGEELTFFIEGVTRAKKLNTLDLSFNPMTTSDALAVLTKVSLLRAKVKTVLMENVNVDGAFLSLLEKTKKKKKIVVTYGNVVGTFKPSGPDHRELVLNRIEFITSRSKRNRTNIALFAQTLQKQNRTRIINKDLIDVLLENGVNLDENLVEELCLAFPAPSKKFKTLDVDVLAEYVKRKWPDRKLPPTPPPEPEPEPEPEPPKKKQTKKGKK